MGGSKLSDMQGENDEHLKESLGSLEESIVPTTWEDKDTDLITQYRIDKEYLHLEDVDELE